MAQNFKEFQKSKYVERSTRNLVDNCVKLLKQIKANPSIELGSPQPKISDAMPGTKPV